MKIEIPRNPTNKDLNLVIDKFTYKLSYNKKDSCIIAKCSEFPSLAAHGNTPEQALSEIITAVKESLKWIIEDQ